MPRTCDQRQSIQISRPGVLHMTLYGSTYATTRLSSPGSRKLSFMACRTLLGRCIGTMYAIVNNHEMDLGK